MGIFALNAYNFSFVLVKAGTLGVDEKTSPVVYAILNLATVLVGLPIGVLADRFGTGRILMLAFGLFFIATLIGYATSTGILVAFLIAFCYGLYWGASETIQRAIVPSLAPMELKGTAYGLFYLLIGICSLVANLVFGFIWDSYSVSAAFGYRMATAATAIIALGVFLRVYTRDLD